jgi:hypothetical protein
MPRQNAALRAATLAIFFGVLSPAAWAQPPFGTVAEGYTSVDERHGIDIAYRMFSAPDVKSLCAAAPRPASFRAANPNLVLHVGQWFSFDRLIIVAQNQAGKTLPPVPIELEVADGAEEDFRSDKIADGGFIPTKRGQIRFRIVAICLLPRRPPSERLNLVVNALIE